MSEKEILIKFAFKDSNHVEDEKPFQRRVVFDEPKTPTVQFELDKKIKRRETFYGL